MQRTLIALGCALALAGGSALAQQQQPQGSSGSSSSGPTLSERAKAAAHAVGDKTKEAAQKAKNAMKPTAESDQAQQMQKRADADLKLAKARCDRSEQKAQKSLCDKQAAARHANAEVEIEKARIAAQRSNTSTMGAGKSSR